MAATARLREKAASCLDAKCMASALAAAADAVSRRLCATRSTTPNDRRPVWPCLTSSRDIGNPSRPILRRYTRRRQLIGGDQPAARAPDIAHRRRHTSSLGRPLLNGKPGPRRGPGRDAVFASRLKNRQPGIALASPRQALCGAATWRRHRRKTSANALAINAASPSSEVSPASGEPRSKRRESRGENISQRRDLLCAIERANDARRPPPRPAPRRALGGEASPRRAISPRAPRA